MLAQTGPDSGHESLAHQIAASRWLTGHAQQCLKRSLLASLSLAFGGIGYLWCLVPPPRPACTISTAALQVVSLQKQKIKYRARPIMATEQLIILAMDQGTTSSRAIFFDQHYAIVDQAQQEFAQHFPDPAGLNTAPDIWQHHIDTAKQAMAKPVSRQQICRHRHHQSARNHLHLGSQHRRTHVQRHCLARSTHRRLLQQP